MVLASCVGVPGCNSSEPITPASDPVGTGTGAALAVKDSEPSPVVAEPEPTLSTPLYNAMLASWRLAPEPRELLEKVAGYNLVLVVVDGLRADLLLPVASETSRHYPHINGLMRQSLRFTQAFSSAAGTDVGMTSLLTGRLHYLYRGRHTLARAFQGAGVRTHGVYQTEVERWLGEAMCRQGHRGRRVLVNDPLKTNFGSRATSRQVSDEGIRFLKRHGGKRFFLWLHYFDVHEHHQVQLKTLSMPDGVVATEPSTARQRYELMLRHVDHHLGRFLAALKEQGLDQKTMVVFAADHGESLGESPRLPAYHGELLYQPLVHVPLSVHIPGVPGRALDTPVSAADVYPTMLDLAGIPAPFKGDGISLTPFLLQDDPAPFSRLVRPLFLMESHQQAVVRWPLKLIAWQDKPKVELYDLARDPKEEHDLVKERPGDVQSLSDLLEQRSLHRVDRRKSYIRKVLRGGNRAE